MDDALAAPVYIDAVRKGGDENHLICAWGEAAQFRQQLVVDVLRCREGSPHGQTVMPTAVTRSFVGWPERLAFNADKLARLRRVLFPNGGPEGAKRPSRRPQG